MQLRIFLGIRHISETCYSYQRIKAHHILWLWNITLVWHMEELSDESDLPIVLQNYSNAERQSYFSEYFYWGEKTYKKNQS